MAEEKKTISITEKVFLGVGIAALIVAAFVIGRNVGCAKGVKIGKEWQWE